MFVCLCVSACGCVSFCVSFCVYACVRVRWAPVRHCVRARLRGEREKMVWCPGMEDFRRI